MGKLKTLYDSDIALLEHEMLQEIAIYEWRPEEIQMYLMGAQAMADKIIAHIRESET